MEKKVMFNRKVVVIALMAVVLLTSFMDGSVSADARQIRKRRVIKTAEAITQTVPAMLQAAGQVDQMALRSIRHKGRKTAFELGDQMALRSIRHKGRKTAFELSVQMAARPVIKEPRKHRII
jgi:hypothetical protein